MMKSFSIILTIPTLAFALFFPSPQAYAAPGFVDSLAGRGRLGIPLDQARQLEARLGQLLVINVDGFGSSGTLALAPGFAGLVERLQVGGVIPHYGSTDYAKIVRTNRALAELTRLPLLICSDIVRLKAPAAAAPGGAGGGASVQGQAPAVASFGDGYEGGFLGRYRDLPDRELRTLARLNAFVFRALGMNVALGPTVDASTAEPRVVERARLVLDEMKRFGLAPVLKHYPTLPAGANLHRESPDTRIPAAEMAERAAAFRALAPGAGIMMTTHFLDSVVDPGIVTFSSAWNAILRAQTGFRGLLMTDGLLMLKNYADRTAISGSLSGGSSMGLGARDAAGVDQAAVWAARAILAGHDMVIVEGSAAQTTRAFEGLLTLACAGTVTGDRLAARITESWKRISDWKEARAALLRGRIDVPPATIQAIIALLPGEGSALAAFHFAPAALALLEPALAAGEAGP